MIQARSGNARRTLYVDPSSITWAHRTDDVLINVMNSHNSKHECYRLTPDEARALAAELIATAAQAEERRKQA